VAQGKKWKQEKIWLIKESHIKQGVVIHRWCEYKKDEICMGLCHVTCLWRKKETRLHTYLYKESELHNIKGIPVLAQEQFTFLEHDCHHVFGKEEIGVHASREGEKAHGYGKASQE